jgi:hypothetical protein
VSRRVADRGQRTRVSRVGGITAIPGPRDVGPDLQAVRGWPQTFEGCGRDDRRRVEGRSRRHAAGLPTHLEGNTCLLIHTTEPPSCGVSARRRACRLRRLRSCSRWSTGRGSSKSGDADPPRPRGVAPASYRQVSDDNPRSLLLQLTPSAPEHLRNVLIATKPTATLSPRERMRYRDRNGQGWADIIDLPRMYSDARRRIVRALGELTAETDP